MLSLDSRRELFVDRYLIDWADGVDLKLHHPTPAEHVMTFDKPWEGAATGVSTVLHDGTQYRLYYRGWPLKHQDSDYDVRPVCCTAVSSDGVHFERPDLGLIEFQGSRRNNIILADHYCHSFAPFLDERPGVPEHQRFKALSTTHGRGGADLIAFCSADGVHWSTMSDEPVLDRTKGRFDSQNVAFWSEHEQCYICYGRTMSRCGDTPGLKSGGKRVISRYTSPDFLNWSDFEPMEYSGTPLEHFYTNQTMPYPRAKHIYIALPKRLVSGRAGLTPDEHEKLGVHPSQTSGISDGILMTSRGGNRYDRTFMEAFVRPGRNLGNWTPRSTMSTWGMIQSADDELSLYYHQQYAQPTPTLRRFTLRLDGFASMHAGWRSGEWVTKPLTFSGSRLSMNLATSAAGGLKVEVQQPMGEPVPGFTLDDSIEHIGDRIDFTAAWRSSPSLATLANRPVRLRFRMNDADLYAIQFTGGE